MRSQLYKNMRQTVKYMAPFVFVIIAVTIVAIMNKSKQSLYNSTDEYINTVNKIGTNSKGIYILLRSVNNKIEQLTEKYIVQIKDRKCKECECESVSLAYKLCDYFKVRIEYSAQLWYSAMISWSNKTLHASHMKAKYYDHNKEAMIHSCETMISLTMKKMVSEFRKRSQMPLKSLHDSLSVLLTHEHNDIYIQHNLYAALNIIDESINFLNASINVCNGRAACESILEEIRINNIHIFHAHEDTIESDIYNVYKSWSVNEHKAYLGAVSIYN